MEPPSFQINQPYHDLLFVDYNIKQVSPIFFHHVSSFSKDDMKKPQVGVSSVWYEGNTCNMHLIHLSQAVKEGIAEAGMIPFRFKTIGVSDAISMGTRGMYYSLQSRDLIADSIETVMAAQWYDANISIPGCDKNVRFLILLLYCSFV